MNELSLPWLEVAILVPLVGALWVARRADREEARRHALVFSGVALALALGAFLDFTQVDGFQAHDRWDLVTRLFGRDLLLVDELSAPLLPLTALVYFLTILATLRSAALRFSFSWALVSEGVVLATLSSGSAWLIIALLIAGGLLPMIEQRRKGRSVRLHGLHLALFSALAVAGQLLVETSTGASSTFVTGVVLVTLAMLMRCGMVPFQCWLTDLFERGSFGTALLFTTPMVGAYGIMRLVLPVAPQWVLDGTALISLATAAYAASMALIQRDSRRFFGFIAVGHSALVLVGLDIATPVGLTGALCMWLSVSLSLTGFGLTLRCVESRAGRLSLASFHGLQRHTPVLGAFFMLTGLASVGFPGTVGFIGAELLFEGANEASPWVGTLLVLASALNGIAVVHAYFRVFTGCEHGGTIDLHIRPSERVAILVLTFLIVGGGLYPQPGIASRYHAAVELIDARAVHEVARRDARLLPAQGASSERAPSAHGTTLLNLRDQ